MSRFAVRLLPAGAAADPLPAQRVIVAVDYALIAAAFLTPVIPLILALSAVVNVPLYDEWLWAPLVVAQHDGTLRFGDVWALQNVHRSLFPTALALVLAKAFGWRTILECCASFALAFATLAMFARAIAGQFTAPWRGAITLLVSIALFSLGQSENWTWGFQVSWFLVNACVAVVAFFVAGRDQGRYALAALAAVVASFSLLTGLGAWAVGAVVLALSPRRPMSRYVVWAVLAALCAGLYFWGFTLPATETAHFEEGPGLGDLAAFVVAYLGAPLGIWGGTDVAFALGALALVAFAAFVVRAVWDRIREPAEAFAVAPWIGIGFFAVIAAALGAVGRSSLGLDAAVTSRYATAGIFFWIALIGLFAHTARRASALDWFGTVRSRLLRRATVWTVCAAGVAFVFLVFVTDAAGRAELLGLHDQQNEARTTVRAAETASIEALTAIWNDPVLVRREAAALRARHDGPFLP